MNQSINGMESGETFNPTYLMSSHKELSQNKTLGKGGGGA